MQLRIHHVGERHIAVQRRRRDRIVKVTHSLKWGILSALQFKVEFCITTPASLAESRVGSALVSRKVKLKKMSNTLIS
jgi:hypothetical protein